MATITPIRVPVCSADGTIIDRVDPARARRLALAPNATVVRKHQTGVRKCQSPIVRILLSDDGNDASLNCKVGDPRRYFYLDCSPAMPEGVFSLKYLPQSTASLYRLAVTDCIKQAA